MTVRDSRRRRPSRVPGVTAALCVLVLAIGVVRVGPVAAGGVPAKTCSPVDVVLVLDTTTSMNPAIANVKSEIDKFVGTVETASGGDYRIGLIDFGRGVSVRVPFADRNADAVRSALPSLIQDTDNSGLSEAWDEALATAVSNRPASALGKASSHVPGQTGDFTVPWRPEANKLVVLVTDARPAGLDDKFDTADIEHARQVAVVAAGAGIHVTTVFIPNGNQEDDAERYLREVADFSGGRTFRTVQDGSNLTEGLSVTVKGCGADSDGDGLFDEWERNGVDVDGDGTVDVDLKAMGAKPDHKDLFIQVDWMRVLRGLCEPPTCPPELASVTPPDPKALEAIGDAFAKAPVANKDGTPGIAVHFDAGSRTPDRYGIPEALRKGHELNDLFVPPRGTKDDPHRSERETQAFKDRWFPPERTSTFTWMLYGAQLSPTKPLDMLGLAPGVPGDTAMVSTYATRSPKLEAVTAMHELGHTLGLRHGGVDDINGKPNYLSIMNYSWSLNTTGLQDGQRADILDYSRFSLEDLDETKLDEHTGVTPDPGTPSPTGYMLRHLCGDKPLADEKKDPASGPVDWNCNSRTDDAAVTHLTHWDTKLGTLKSRNDWATLTFTGGVRGGLVSDSEPVVEEDNFTLDGYRAAPHVHGVLLSGPAALDTPSPDEPLTVAYQVDNVGGSDDSFDVTVNVTGEAAGRYEHPSTLDVGARSLGTAAVLVQFRDGAASGETATVDVAVTSRTDPAQTATARTDIRIGGTSTPPRTGHLTLQPDNPKPGASVTVTGTGFKPGGAVTLSSSPAWVKPRVIIADGDGGVATELVVPDDADSDANIVLSGPTGPATNPTPGTGPVATVGPRPSVTVRPATTIGSRSTVTARGTTGTTQLDTSATTGTVPAQLADSLQLVGVAHLDKPGAAPPPAHPYAAAADSGPPWLMLAVPAVLVVAAACAAVWVRSRRTQPS